MEVDKSNFSEWYNTVLYEADIIDIRYPVKGMPVYRPWGFSIMRRCFEILENVLDETGHEQMLFPLLIPEDIFGKEGEHIKGFEDQVLWATHAGLSRLERKLAVRPTSETVMYPMFSLWIRSHADLPLKVHQTVCVYRNETKATKPLIRGREVYWNEAHTVHASKEDAEKQIREAYRIYKEFYEKLGIATLALKRPEHDKFAGADYSIALEALMPDGRVLQVGTIHNLGQNFSKVYEVCFADEKGDKQYAYQTSYGISMRCLAAIVSIHGDSRGLILPPDVAPIQAIIVPILYRQGAGVIDRCREVAAKLSKCGIRCYVDESDARPGDKFYKWECKGVPIRLEIGPKEVESNTVLIALRTGGKKTILMEDLCQSILAAFNEVREKLFENSKKSLEEAIKNVERIEELGENGFFRAGWCGSTECADELKNEKTIDVRGIEYGKETRKRKCIVCGADGFEVFLAKGY